MERERRVLERHAAIAIYQVNVPVSLIPSQTDTANLKNACKSRRTDPPTRLAIILSEEKGEIEVGEYYATEAFPDVTFGVPDFVDLLVRHRSGSLSAYRPAQPAIQNLREFREKPKTMGFLRSARRL